MTNDITIRDGQGKGLTPFEFDGRNVRLVDREGETWFVATDVARELGYRDAADLIRLLDDDEKGTHTMRTSGGDQVLGVISEPALYRAIIQRRANKKHDDSLLSRIARFQRWVFHDILPSIRKTGSFGLAPKAIDVRDMGQLSTIALQLIEVNQELRDENLQLVGRAADAEAKVEADRPKTTFFDQFVNAEGLYGLQNGGRVLSEPPNKFIGMLKKEYVFYQGGALVPYQRFRAMGIFEVKVEMVDEKARYRTFLTPKGISYFAKKLGKADPLQVAA